MAARLTGLVAATHTPFHDDGSLNLDVIEQQAEGLVKARVSAAFITGTTGECSSLTIDERIAVTRRWTEVVKGSPLKVIVHVGSNCQADSVALAKAAAECHAAGFSAFSPSYFKPANVPELLRFLTPITSAAAALPFYFYDIPSMTAVSLSMVTFLEQAPAKLPNLAGIKYTNGDLVQLQELLRLDPGRFDILFGSDEALLAAWTLGVKGAVGSTYNFAAAIYHRVLAAFDRGDWETARQQQAESVRLVRLLCQYTYMPASRHVLTLQGIPVGPTRSPLKQLSEEEQASLERDLHASGLWQVLQAD